MGMPADGASYSGWVLPWDDMRSINLYTFSLFALAALAPAQVMHTHVETWTGPGTNNAALYHSSTPTVSWPAVLGWWCNAGWPLVEVDSTTTIDLVVPADPTGAPVRYGWDSYLRVMRHWDVNSPWAHDDLFASHQTAGGTLPTTVHVVELQHVQGSGLDFMYNTQFLPIGVTPVGISSQVGVTWNGPANDAWVVVGPSPGPRVPAGATIDVQTTVTATWAFAPNPITYFGSGDTGCGGVPNTTGLAAQLEICGSPDRADDSLFASIWSLPPHTYGILAGAPGGGGPVGVSSSVCISGQGGVNRLVVLQADENGEIAYRMPPSHLWPSPPFGFQTTFQFWFRDTTPAGSNVTNAYLARFL